VQPGIQPIAELFICYLAPNGGGPVSLPFEYSHTNVDEKLARWVLASKPLEVTDSFFQWANTQP